MLSIPIKIMALTLLLVLSGCAAGNYGASSRDLAVDRLFRSGRLSEAYRYYYNGVELEPTAILGIRRPYTLQSRFWTEVDLDERRLRNWRAFFVQSYGWYDDRSHGRMRFDGYRLTDPQGDEVGILFSRYDWIVLEFPAKGVVIVHPPQPQPINRMPLRSLLR